MRNKRSLQFIVYFMVAAIIIFSTGFLGTGLFWGIKAAFGYGGGGSSYTPPANTNLNQPITVTTPTINPFLSPINSATIIINGTRSDGTTIVINDSTQNIIYPSATTWEALLPLSEGSNNFTIFARDGLVSSAPIVAVIIRQNNNNSGDITNDNQVDDLDLALIVSHWNENWSAGDLNLDGVIDDLDLAFLVSHWT